MINNSLPSFIHVANLKDIFWNNNSDLYPTKVPALILYTIVEKTRPVLHSPYVGTCVLQGEFNHCVYNDTYYFLTKLEVIDLTNQIYKYQMDYDVMINFIYKSGSVKGVLTKTNDPEILEECLQNTIPILSDPINQEIIGFSDKTKKWQDELVIKTDWINKKLLGNLIECSISSLDFENFIYRVNNNFLGKASVNKKWQSNSVQSTVYSIDQLIDPLFILDFLPTTTDISWKTFVVDKLKDFLSEENKQKLIITKQSSIEGHFNNGGYVLSIENKAIGTKITEAKKIDLIDLSNLEDIIPINSQTGKVLEPDVAPKYGHLHFTEKSTFENPVILEVGRIPYLPIKQKNKPPVFVLQNNYTDNENYESESLNYNGNPPQKIIFKDNSEGYLWYIDKNNVPLLVDKNSGKLKVATVNPKSDYYRWWPHYALSYKNIPPLGFLIYQQIKDRSLWDHFEYKGTNNLTNISYRSGLTNKIRTAELWTNTRYKWKAISNGAILSINKSPILAEIYMEADLFSWLTIAPSSIGADSKYFVSNSWNYRNFYPKAKDPDKYYASRINYMDITPLNIVNPYNENRIGDFLNKRDNFINSFSLISSFKVTHPIKSGDLVFSSLNYEIQSTPHSFWSVPYDFTNDERKNLLRKQYVYPKQTLDYENAIREYDEQARVSLGGLTNEDYSKGGWHLTSKILRGLWVPFAPYEYTREKEQYSEQFLNEDIKLLSSFINRDQESKSYLNNRVILYLYKGEYRLGIFRELDETLELNDSYEQIVSSVDGTTSKQVKFYHIQRIDNGVIDFRNSNPVSETLKQSTLEYALSACKGSINNNIYHYSKKDLEGNIPRTFDLKGTDWYFICYNNAYHLVPKNNKVLVPEDYETRKLEINIKNIPSTFAKINQKATFLYYGQTIPLNTKFNFKDDSFKVDLLSMDVGNQYADPNFEYKNVVINEPNDCINTWLALPLKETKAADKVDAAQLLMMKERLASLTTNYEQDRIRNELLMDDKRLMMARQREDLDFQWKSSVANIGTTAAMSIVGGAAGRTLGGAMTGGKLSAMAAGTALGVARAGMGLKSDIEFLVRYPTFMKRIDEDERSAIMANTQHLYQRKQNYEHDFKIQTYKLNQLTNSFIQPNINNREVVEAYNKKQGFKDVSVQILLPSSEQQKQIDHIYTTYGCECISTRFLSEPLHIYDGMETGLYQFSKIEVGGIESPIISDITLRNIIQQIFENGVKFLDIEHIPTQEEVVKFKVLKGAELDFDTTKISEWSREMWDIYNVKSPKNEIIETIKKIPRYGLTEEEYEKYKNQIRTDNDENLLKDINTIIHNRDAGITIQIGFVPEDDQQDLKACKQKIKNLFDKMKTKYLTQGKSFNTNVATNDLINYAVDTDIDTIVEIDDLYDISFAPFLDNAVNVGWKLKNDLRSLKLEKDKVDKDIIDKSEEIKNLKSSLQDCEGEKTDIEQQLRNCEDRIVQLNKKQETCDIINTREIKDLKAKIKECEDRIKEKQIEIDAKERGLTASVNRANTLSEQYKNLEAQLTQERNLVNLYKQEANNFKTQLEECRSSQTSDGRYGKLKSDLKTLFNNQARRFNREIVDKSSGLASRVKQKSDRDEVGTDDLQKLMASMRSIASQLLRSYTERKTFLNDIRPTIGITGEADSSTIEDRVKQYIENCRTTASNLNPNTLRQIYNAQNSKFTTGVINRLPDITDKRIQNIPSSKLVTTNDMLQLLDTMNTSAAALAVRFLGRQSFLYSLRDRLGITNETVLDTIEAKLRETLLNASANKIEIVSLKKQKENLENQKNDIERQLRECLTEKIHTLDSTLTNFYNTYNTNFNRDVLSVVPSEILRLENIPQGHFASSDIFNDLLSNIFKMLGQLTRSYSDRKLFLSNIKIDVGIPEETNFGKIEQKITDFITESKQKPKFSSEDCELLQKIASDSRIDIDIKERPSELSYFTDLCFVITENMRWIRLSRTDSFLSKYHEMELLFEELWKLQTADPMPICETIVENHNWSKWENFLLGNMSTDLQKEAETFNSVYTEIPDVMKVVRQSRQLHTVYGFKKQLDRLNLVVFNTIKKLGQSKFDEDPQLEHFFKHFYPTQKIRDLYKKLFDIDMDFSLFSAGFVIQDCKDLQQNLGIIDLLKSKQSLFRMPSFTIKPDDKKIPPITNSIVFSDGGHSFIEHLGQTKNTPWYFMPQGDVPYKTTYTYGEKLERSTMRGRAVQRASIRGYRYSRGNKRWAWAQIRTEYWSSDTFFSGQQGDTRDVYMRVVEEEILRKVNNCIEAILKKRNKIPLPEHINTKIKNGEDLIRTVTIRNWDYYNVDSPTDYTATINLTKTFGKDHDAEAWKILGILDAAKIWLNKVGVYDNLYAYEVKGRYWDTADDVITTNQDFLYYFDDTKRSANIVGENMFLDIRSLFSWILTRLYENRFLMPSGAYPSSFISFLDNVEENQ